MAKGESGEVFSDLKGFDLLPPPLSAKTNAQDRSNLFLQRKSLERDIL